MISPTALFHLHKYQEDYVEPDPMLPFKTFRILYKKGTDYKHKEFYAEDMIKGAIIFVRQNNIPFENIVEISETENETNK
jgi:hypothetical protein